MGYRSLILGITSLLWVTTATAADPAKKPATTQLSEVKVTLFGQPCLLSGPFSEGVLNAIHGISPEKMPSPQSAQQAKQTLDKLSKTPRLPVGLEVYRDHLTKHTQALRAFYEAIPAAKKAGKAEPLLKAVRPHLQGTDETRFEMAAKKTTTWTPAAQSQLNESYLEAIEEYPEEEFHRATRQMNINYTCDFATETDSEE